LLDILYDICDALFLVFEVYDLSDFGLALEGREHRELFLEMSKW